MILTLTTLVVPLLALTRCPRLLCLSSWPPAPPAPWTIEFKMMTIEIPKENER